MAIKPIDVRRKEFKNSLRGYDANQVDDFLDSVADEFERTYTENTRMREEISGLRERLQQFSDLEGSIRAALVHAEQAASDLRESANREAETLRESARREAELTINEAKARSHQMLADSSSRVERVQESYEALREAKQSFANDFRQLLKSYADVLENMEVSTAKEIESSLRNRLDTESVAVAREAAAHAPEQQPTPEEHPDSEPEAPAAEPSPSIDHDEEETRAFTPEDMAAAQGLAVPPAEATQVEDTQQPAQPTAAEQTGSGTYEPFERPAADEGIGPLSPQEDDAPVATEPEIEPSTVAEDERGTDTPVVGADDGDDTREQQAPVEESQDPDARYDAFFDKGGTPGEQESRVSRASRFLRRRGS